MREQDSRVAGRNERESTERDTLIEGTIMGLGRNLVPGKLQGTHKADPIQERVTGLVTTIIFIIEP